MEIWLIGFLLVLALLHYEDEWEEESKIYKLILTLWCGLAWPYFLGLYIAGLKPSQPTNSIDSHPEVEGPGHNGRWKGHG
jgi:hypothetical protein